MNRREFYQQEQQWAIAPNLAFDRTTPYQHATSSQKKVVIAGGGLAGLTCGYELRKLGFFR